MGTTVLIVIGGLAAFYFGWLSIHKTNDKVALNLEVERIKKSAEGVRAKGKELIELVRHH